MTSPIDSKQKGPKQKLREQLRQARQQLSLDEQRLAAQKIIIRAASHIINSQHAFNAQHIALYLSNDGEISPHLLCEYFWQQGKHLYLPVIQKKQLIFALYTRHTIWQKNRFGIKEPISAENKASHELDLVFLPLVGFDHQGRRLGMGGGFYDRTFAHKKSDESPLLIGLAHDCQQVTSLSAESWDVPLQAIITPSQTFMA